MSSKTVDTLLPSGSRSSKVRNREKFGKHVKNAIPHKDRIAQMVSQLTYRELELVSYENRYHARYLQWKDRGLNEGMLQMNTRNFLRRIFKVGVRITLLGEPLKKNTKVTDVYLKKWRGKTRGMAIGL